MEPAAAAVSLREQWAAALAAAVLLRQRAQPAVQFLQIMSGTAASGCVLRSRREACVMLRWWFLSDVLFST